MLVVVGFIGVFWLAGLWQWAVLWGLVAVAVGAAELLALWSTGRTASQAFWKFRREHPLKAWGLIALIFSGEIALLAHLLWRK